ncbi:hypothetical protein EDB83DRAFT_2323980 [Lactarius deliciosus]|nr:hypothetical protein EDB83DRAFT_2323980 [Lactarius deliciosus]
MSFQSLVSSTLLVFPVRVCLCSNHIKPGSAVAVERVFSGGRDTISLRLFDANPQLVTLHKPYDQSKAIYSCTLSAVTVWCAALGPAPDHSNGLLRVTLQSNTLATLDSDTGPPVGDMEVFFDKFYNEDGVMRVCVDPVNCNLACGTKFCTNLSGVLVWPPQSVTCRRRVCSDHGCIGVEGLRVRTSAVKSGEKLHRVKCTVARVDGIIRAKEMIQCIEREEGVACDFAEVHYRDELLRHCRRIDINISRVLYIPLQFCGWIKKCVHVLSKVARNKA